MTREVLDYIRLRDGGGGGVPQHGMCVMELVNWLEGANYLSDRPASASPWLTHFAIALNDCAPSTRTRSTLAKLAPLLLNSLDPESESTRIKFIFKTAARTIIAPHVKRAGFAELARVLMEAEEIGDYVATAHALRAIEKPSALMLGFAAATDAYAAHDEYAGAGMLFSPQDGLIAQEASSRARLAIWRKLKDALASALLIGRHGDVDDARMMGRLRKLAKVADEGPTNFDPRIKALVFGPAGDPKLPAAPKSKKQTKAALEQA